MKASEQQRDFREQESLRHFVLPQTLQVPPTLFRRSPSPTGVWGFPKPAPEAVWLPCSPRPLVPDTETRPSMQRKRAHSTVGFAVCRGAGMEPRDLSRQASTLPLSGHQSLCAVLKRHFLYNSEKTDFNVHPVRI